jgi:hypothetical protein
VLADTLEIPHFQIGRTRTSQLFSRTLMKRYRPLYNKGRIVAAAEQQPANDEEEEDGAAAAAANDVLALPFGWTGPPPPAQQPPNE